MGSCAYLLPAAPVLLLLPLAREDLKTRSVPVWPVLLFSAAALFIRLLMPGPAFSDGLAGLVPGFVLFLLSRLPRAGIGGGDGLCAAACGSAAGFWPELSALIAGLLLCAVFSLVMLRLGKVKRRDSLPFLPFLLLGHLFIFLASL